MQYRWSPRFSPGVESTCILVWIELPRLRAHLQSLGALHSIVGMVGKFLCADSNVAQFTRLGTSRVCIVLREFALKWTCRSLYQAQFGSTMVGRCLLNRW